MKKYRDIFGNLLLTRLTILLEFEPGDAMQAGYFQYLDILRKSVSSHG